MSATDPLSPERGPRGVASLAMMGADEPEAPPMSADEPELAKLAAMDPLDYDRERKSVAERLGVRTETLDREIAQRRRHGRDSDTHGGSALYLPDPDPWPQTVDGAALLAELAQRIRRHVQMSAASADAEALWVIHSHTHQSAGISPILAITSPAPECGKTTLLGLLAAVVPRPMTTANITTAALFRVVEQVQPTLLIDEGDTFIRAGDELRGVLNSGHSRTSAYVIRTVGDDHEPRRFATWAPKAIALIGELPATLASRSIHIELRRLAPAESVEPFRADRPPKDLERLRRQAWRWAQDHIEALSEANPEIPSGLRGRAADNWRHLLAIADAAGGEWASRARRAAADLASSRAEGADDAITTTLLADLRDLFDEGAEDRLTSKEIVDHLGAMEDRPWPEWGRQQKPITTRQLARLLKPFGVEPRSIRTVDGTPKGYLLADLTDAFSRYLPARLGDSADLSATAPQVNKDGGLSDFPIRNIGSRVADRKPHNSLTTNKCCGVADGKGGLRGVTEVEL